MERIHLIDFFKRMNEALFPVEFRLEERLENLILSRAAMHRLEKWQIGYLKIFFFILSQLNGEGQAVFSLGEMAKIIYSGENRKEARGWLGMAIEYFRQKKIFKPEWITEESFRIDAVEIVKVFSPWAPGMEVFKKLNNAFFLLAPKVEKKLHELLFECLRVQQFGLVELMRVFFYILSLIDEEGRVSITFKTLFETLARPDRKEELTPSQFRIDLILQELERRKAFSISWTKDKTSLRIDADEVFIFLRGFKSLIKPAFVVKWKDE